MEPPEQAVVNGAIQDNCLITLYTEKNSTRTVAGFYHLERGYLLYCSLTFDANKYCSIKDICLHSSWASDTYLDTKFGRSKAVRLPRDRYRSYQES